MEMCFSVYMYKAKSIWYYFETKWYRIHPNTTASFSKQEKIIDILQVKEIIVKYPLAPQVS